MAKKASTARAARTARESAPLRQERALRLLAGLRRLHPDATCALLHKDPLQLLVATILSAQCTDVRVNQVTRELFSRCRSAADYVKLKREELEETIRSTGFFRNKAKSIQGMAQRLLAEHGGKVPRTMPELLELPGVARKTANVVLGTAFGKNEGVVVDTHVFRLSRRLGLSRGQSPVAVERDLMKLFPRDSWTFLGHAVIWHGRKVCHARKPRCADCEIAPDCPSAFRA